jgi:hypothetical protein
MRNHFRSLSGYHKTGYAGAKAMLLTPAKKFAYRIKLLT